MTILITIILSVGFIGYTERNKQIQQKAKLSEIRQQLKQQQQAEIKEQARASEAQARSEKRKEDRLRKEANLTPQQRRTKQIEKAFSPWDGSHLVLTRVIKKAMNDPDSYKHDQTTYTDAGDTILVRASFRGTNKFGAIVRNTVTAKTDIDCNVLKILSQQ
jgi:hypothetical protein